MKYIFTCFLRRGPAKSAKESAFDAQNKAMAQALKADAASATTPQQDEVAKIKRDRQIIDLESGTFEPKSFTSSRKAPVASGATHHNDEAPVIVDTFAFGMCNRQFDTKKIARSHRSSETGCYCELHTKISSCYNEPRSCLNLIF